MAAPAPGAATCVQLERPDDKLGAFVAHFVGNGLFRLSAG
jgi:hypothetical protein